MAQTERITITVPTDVADKLRHAVTGGRYTSADEVVSEAVRDWTADGDVDLHAAIEAGLNSGSPIPAAQVLAELHARYARD